MRTEPKATRRNLQRWGVVAAVWACTLVVGGVMPRFVGLWLLALSGLIALGAAGSAKRWPLAVWGLVGLGIYTAAQCVPLPLGALRALDPTTARIWSDAFELLSLDTQWAPVSIEPESTRLEAAKWLGYAALWALSARFARHLGLRAALLAIWTLALAVAGISALHQYADATRVYGLYAPISAPFASAGPLLNPNNLAGLLNLGTFCALGWALHRRATMRQLGVGLLAAAVLGAASLLGGSRAGAAMLLLGLMGYAGALLLTRGRALPRGRMIGLGVALAIGAAFFLLALQSSLESELLNPDLAKLEVVRASAAVAFEHPVLGVGRGALAPEIGRLLDAFGLENIDSDVVFVHAENWPLEWLAGWGLAVGGTCLVSLLVLLRPRTSWLRDPSRTAAYVGLLTVLLQNLLDLGLEIPGLAAPMVFLLAAATTSVASVRSVSLQDSGRLNEGEPPSSAAGRRRWPIDALASLTFAAGVVTLAIPPRLAEVERLALRTATQDGVSVQQRKTEIEQALRRHPADAYVMRLGALVLLAERDPATLRWLNQALLQQPNNGRTHLVLAEALGRMGQLPQALAALRAGIERHPAIAGPAARWALTHAPDQVDQIVPRGRLSSVAAMALAQHVTTPQARRHWTQRAQQALPEEERDHLALANVTLAALLSGQPPCDTQQQRCIEEVQSELSSARAAGVDETSLILPQSRVLLLQGSNQAVFDQLTHQCPRHPDRAQCSSLLLSAAAALGERELAEAKPVYLDAQCDAAAVCASAHRHLSALYRQRQRWLLALEHARQAAERAPSWAAWLDAAELAMRAGRPRRAQLHLERATRLATDEGADVQARLRTAREELLRDLP